MGSEHLCGTADAPHAQSAPPQGTWLCPPSKSAGRHRPTLPVVLVVTGAGHSDEGGEEQREKEGTEPERNQKFCLLLKRGCFEHFL